MSDKLQLGKEMLEEMKKLGWVGWTVTDEFPEGVYTYYGIPVIITDHLEES